MTLTLKHFDTRTGEWITIPNSNIQNRQDNPNIILTEKSENTLLEAFLKKRISLTKLQRCFIYWKS
ncbi:hypothetical protein [Crocosphaera watsonii]|nr:hypothetical protein [Crocosphaera watsonii]